MRRLTIKFVIDLVLWSLVTPLAFALRLEDGLVRYGPDIVAFILIGLPVKAAAIYWLGYYRRTWSHVGMRDLFSLWGGVLAVTLVMGGAAFYLPETLNVPRSVPLIEGLLALLVLGAARLTARLFYEKREVYRSERRRKPKRVLVVGAGEAGLMISREMQRHPRAGRKPIGFLDDDEYKHRQVYQGMRVLGTIDELPQVVRKMRVDEVLIAMPSASGTVVRRVVKLAQEAEVAHRIIPGISELLDGRVSMSQIREVDVKDLLRREAVELDMDSIAAFVQDRVVLVTGAGGSIGSEIARQVARFDPRKLVLLGRGEGSLYHVTQELNETHPGLPRVSVLANIRDHDTLDHVFRTYRPQVVFHAAAHKHVPMLESNPEQAVFNNVGGTKNLAELALKYEVERFVNISTDKAVNPTSIMGASKRVAEQVVHWASRRCEPGQCFVSVRFGNVLGSRGSVIPLFKRQIERGGPVTVTHPEMKRYFMTIPEASQLVLQAVTIAHNGAVCVLDMGEPVRIMDLAHDLITLSGLQPNHDIEVQVTGIRPGEKLFEELLTAEEGAEASRHEKVFIARKNGFSEEVFVEALDDLFEAAMSYDEARVRSVLKRIVPSCKFPVEEEQEAVRV